MYEQITYRLNGINEVKYIWKGKQGRKGETRAPKRKPTRKEVELQNRRNKRDKIHRELIVNFTEEDYWVTLTYKKGERKNMEGVKKDFKRLRENLGRAYQKQGEKLKWMVVIEIGKKGGIHLHMVMNSLPQTIGCLNKYWKQGHIHVVPLYPENERKQLADYMAKMPDEEENEGEIPPKDKLPETQKENYYYSSSKNLIRPQPERKRYKRRTMRKILENGPEPTEGFYIVKDTVRKGVNRFTGYSYLYYTEVTLRRRN